VGGVDNSLRLDFSSIFITDHIDGQISINTE